MRAQLRRIFGAGILLAASACSTTGGRTGDGNNNNNNSGNAKHDLAVANNNTSTDMAVSSKDPDFSGLGDVDFKGACGVQMFTLQKAGPPDLMIVLDRSGSMGSGPGSSWDAVTTAINSVVMMLQGMIKWGIEFFPTDDSCGVSATVAVGVAPDTAMAIATAIGMNTPQDGSTPTADAVRKAAQYLSGVADTNPKYLVLATDGAPNCDAPTTPGSQSTTCTCSAPLTQSGTNCCFSTLCIPCSFLPSSDSGAGQAVSDAAALGVNTFVIGVATDSSEDAVLNDLATKGGTARPGTTKYYPAANQAEFIDAINTITGQIISCTLALGTAPANPDLVTIQTGSTTIPQDTTHANGWDYGPSMTSIILYGSFCTQLQSGAITDLQAILDCPPIS